MRRKLKALRVVHLYCEYCGEHRWEVHALWQYYQAGRPYGAITTEVLDKHGEESVIRRCADNWARYYNKEVEGKE